MNKEFKDLPNLFFLGYDFHRCPSKADRRTLSLPEPRDEEREYGEYLETSYEHQKGEEVFGEGSGRLEGATGTIGAQTEAVAADGGDRDADRLVEGHAGKA